jgi:hypothetical protein
MTAAVIGDDYTLMVFRKWQFSTLLSWLQKLSNLDLHDYAALCRTFPKKNDFFFPSVIETILLTALVCLVAFLFNLFVLWSASRTRQRFIHMGPSMLLTIVRITMLVTIHIRGIPGHVFLWTLGLGRHL